MGYVRGGRVELPGDEKLRARVRVLQQSHEGSAAVEGHARDAGAGVPDPVGFAELRGGAEEYALALELVELVR